MPPTNITALTALVIPSLPYSITQNITGLVPDGAGNIDLWYAYTAVAGDNVIGALSKKTIFTTTGDGPWTEVNLGPAAAPVLYLGAISNTNGREQVPVTPGVTYYFVMRWDGGAGVFDETFAAYRFVDTATIPGGSLFIGNDSNGYPGAFLTSSVALLAFEQGIVGGESGDLTPAGRLLLTDDFNDRLALYQYDGSRFVLLTYIALQADVGQGNGTTRFYVIQRSGLTNGSTTAIRAISVDGVLGQQWNLPVISAGWFPRYVAVSPDETIAYITNVALYASGGGNIARWDLVNNVALPDLVGQFGFENLFANNVSLGTLKVMADGAIIAGYWNNAETLAFLRRYSPAGAPLNTYPFNSVGAGGLGLLDKIALDPSTQLSVIVWAKTAFGIGGFFRLTLSDGTTVLLGTDPEVRGGAMILRASEIANLFGHPFSCPFFVLPSSLPLPAGCPAGLGLQPVQGLPGCTDGV